MSDNLDPAALAYQKAQLQIEAGDLNSALATANDCIQLYPQSAYAYALRAQVMIKQRRTEEGQQIIADIEEALRLDPKLAKPYVLRAEVNMGWQFWDKALADLEIASTLESSSGIIAYHTSACLYKLGRWDESLLFANQAVSLCQGSPMPSPATARTLRAMVLNELLQCDLAIADASAAIVLLEAYADQTKFSGALSDAYHQRGKAYFIKENWPAALADFNLAIQLDPEFSSRLYGRRGHVHEILGDPEKALADFDEAIRLDPDDAGAYLNRGKIYWQKGDLLAAIADYNRVTEVLSDWRQSVLLMACLMRAMCYIRQSEWTLALEDVERLIENFASPRHMWIKVAAYEVRAQCHDLYGRDDDARRDRQTAWQLRLTETLERPRGRQSPGRSSPEAEMN